MWKVKVTFLVVQPKIKNSSLQILLWLVQLTVSVLVFVTKKNPLNILHIFLFKDLFFQVNLRITYVKSQCYVISAMISGKNSSITANIKNPFFFKRLADSHITTNKQSLSDMFVFLRCMCKFAKKILPTRYL